MDRARCDHEDCVVLAAALRHRMACPPLAERVHIRAELRQLIDRVQASGPLDLLFGAGIDVADSLVVLGRPSDALDCVDGLLAGPSTGTPRRPR